jgi:hypothetical protein
MEFRGRTATPLSTELLSRHGDLFRAPVSDDSDHGGGKRKQQQQQLQQQQQPKPRRNVCRRLSGKVQDGRCTPELKKK